MHNQDPAAVIQRQLDAYNAKDVDGWLSTYSDNAIQFALHGEKLTEGKSELKARIQARFEEPDLHARLLSRTVMGNIVVDFEEVTRNFPEGLGTLEMLCIYEVVDGRIQRASFSLGSKRLVGTKSVA